MGLTNGIGNWNGRQGANVNQDTDAKLFIASAGITDTAQKTIVNDLVKDYKTAGLWDKRKAIYPFIGGVAGSTKFNLKDARDLDAAFRITWGGTVTHSALGIKGNGTTGFGNTHLTQNGDVAWNNFSFACYSRDDTNSASGIDMGTGLDLISAYNTGAAAGILIGGSTYGGTPLVQYNNSKGLFSVSRLSNILQYSSRNGKTIAEITTSISVLVNTAPFMICKSGSNDTASSFSNRQLSFACIGDGLTPYEMFLEYVIVRKYINAMDNLSAYNNQILFESWQPAVISQVSLILKVNYGHVVYVDFGNSDIRTITGDGSNVTITSNYTVGSKTYYCRIYGELSQIIRFQTVTATNVSGLFFNDFKRLNIPLYCLISTVVGGCGLNILNLPQGLVELILNDHGKLGIGRLSDLPKYIVDLSLTGDSAFTSEGLAALPAELAKIYLATWTNDTISVDNLPVNIQNVQFDYCTTATGKIKNIPTSAKYISLIGCGTGVNITDTPMKAWATTIIILTSGYITASVDGFFNSYAAVAGNGSATINLAGTGAGVVNQAASAASLTARTTLAGLGKTISIN